MGRISTVSRAVASCATMSLALLVAVWAPTAAAQEAAAPVAFSLEGRTIEGAPFNLGMLKGKVVLVMFWSTDCAVCRDKMPELRTNYEGWAGKPFEVVAVNTDGRMQDFVEYERIISQTIPIRQRFVQLWRGESSYRDSAGKPGQLPTSFLIDKKGAVVERYVGRIPPETWDRISDLL
jgi:thiol-disulfide isomerase/thioredoxin